MFLHISENLHIDTPYSFLFISCLPFCYGADSSGRGRILKTYPIPPTPPLGIKPEWAYMFVCVTSHCDLRTSASLRIRARHYSKLRMRVLVLLKSSAPSSWSQRVNRSHSFFWASGVCAPHRIQLLCNKSVELRASLNKAGTKMASMFDVRGGSRHSHPCDCSMCISLLLGREAGHAICCASTAEDWQSF